MNVDTYPPPVNKLLTYGASKSVLWQNWPNYAELGLGPEHIPDLIRMATDNELLWADSESLEVWAPIHAWRALGQLRAQAAIEPLLTLFEVPDEEDNEWAMEELPEVYGLIGPIAIPAITAYMADKSHGTSARIAASNCLEKIGTMHPEARDECIAALTGQLEQFAENDPEMNGFLVSNLIDLKAVEAAPTIERAFAAERVDLIVVGDWNDVQVTLGLKSYAEVAGYTPPVAKLLTYGDGREVGRNIKDWSQYLELGLGPEHIPELIRMATDPKLRWTDSDSLEVWAPIHAWRALGQLQAEAAIEPLLPLFEEAEDDDWVMEELPDVIGMIGPAAIPAVTAYVADESNLDWPRICASSCLEKIGTMHPEARDKCVAALIGQLEQFEENDLELNGFLVSNLIDLKAVEAAPVIERAFAAGCVEPGIAGDWYDVQVQLGLKTGEEARQERSRYYNSLLDRSAQLSTNERIAFPGSPSPLPSHKSKADQKKAKHKMAKQSRKKNRRRK